MRFIPKDKKGDIPTILLVVGVIALCGLAIFIFIGSLNKTKGSFDNIEEVEKANRLIERDSLESYHNEVNDSGSFLNFWKEDKLVFLIDYSSP